MQYRNLIVVAVLALSMLGTASLHAQKVDARISLLMVDDQRQDRVEFDVVVTRVDDSWQHWANTTLRIEAVALRQTGGLIAGVHRIDLVPGSSDLALVPYDATQMRGYTCTADIVQGRIRILVYGPDSLDQTIQLSATRPTIRIGRFALSTVDGSAISTELAFAEPTEVWQAHAAKLVQDSIITAAGQEVYVYRRHDNVEIATRYGIGSSTTPDCDSVQIMAFEALYRGDLSVQLRFSTVCEEQLDGFLIERALVDRRRPNVLEFQARANLDYANNTSLAACGTCDKGRTVDDILDGVEYRREAYAYRLVGVRAGRGDRIIFDTAVVHIPNAIVSNASVLRNPFRDRVDVLFDADDRLRIDAAAYDVLGNKLGDLVDADGHPMVNLMVQRGSGYRASFNVGDIASQGLVNIVIIGHPIDDRSIDELSRIVLKAQHLR
ncbi:MAG: hypothetical protein FGM24_02595 [Candidatus Kapabacteria bacterium]|nr:hypothetical protein [Candidatus Kapabacteria bacterium]